MIDAHARRRRGPPDIDPPGLRQEAGIGVLGVEAGLDGMARELHLLLAERQPLAARHPQLPFDQVEAGDGLGHGMLDLQARVHLEEVEGAVTAQQEFDRACAAITDRLGGGDCGRAHVVAQIGVDRGRGGFLDHLLVAALHRTIALAEMDDVAVIVGEHLNLDVARIDHGFFQDQLARTEGALGLGARRADRLAKIAVALDQPHAPSAAAGRRLHHHRQADLARLFLEAGVALIGALIARHARHAGIDHAALGGSLVAHGGDGSRRRADEDQPRLATRRGECLILRQKPVTRMDGIGAGLVRRLEDAVDAEIALATGGGPMRTASSAKATCGASLSASE